MSIAVELAAFNEESHRLGAQNIIDASVCLQNFDSMNHPDQEVIPATLPDHLRKEENSLELGSGEAQDRPEGRDKEPNSRVPGDPMPVTSSTSTPAVIRPIVSASPESAKEPSSSGKRKPRKLNPKT